MNSLLAIFANNILPVLLISSCGYLLAKFLHIDPKPISQIIFYILSPCFIFITLLNNHLNGQEIIRIAGFTIANILVIGLIGWLIGYLLHWERAFLSAALLAVMFTNSGNYGLALSAFYFGESALAYASMCYIATAVMMHTVGVIVASTGKSGLKPAMQSLVRVPVIYAVGLAFLFAWLQIDLPVPLEKSLNLLAGAAIPAMLLLLGLQLGQSKIQVNLRALSIASFLRLVASPFVAFGLNLLFGLQGLAKTVSIIQVSMPSAVITTILATQYDTEPSFVTNVVFITTLLSPITLTPLLAYLGA